MYGRKGGIILERLSVDISRCMAGGPEATAVTPRMLEGLLPRLEEARKVLLANAGKGPLGWMDLPQHDPRPWAEFAKDTGERYDAVLVIGIGGSALGTIALGRALLPFFYNELSFEERGGRPRLYVLDNVDPEETAALLKRLRPERTLVNVVSKSGTTAESMAGLLVVKQVFEAALGREALRSHFIFTTDPIDNALRRMGEALNIPVLDIPPGVGGRFSVLSVVSLLPAALVGIDVCGLIEGARDMADWIERSSGWENPACAFAGIHYLEDTALGRGTCVMMPYSARLRDVADWFRQLWAESLGKEVDRQGQVVNVGPHPVRAQGVTDQHSQLQLYAEGPDDKIITFLGVREFSETVPIPAPGPEGEAVAYLGGHTLAELMWAEQKATAWALWRKGRPSVTITLPRVDAFSIGALLYMFEVATAIAGELYDVNAFDQPGVEMSKQATYALMGCPGYERLAGEVI
ncbi:MAG: glucose-6-phosphate isomerase [Thermoleophilia bacterium]|nr:glucose-6-phosphate isomerase [Thermoleophilia bacterium]